MIEVSITGPAGAGKTTVAHALALILKSSGHVVNLYDGGEAQKPNREFAKLQDLSSREVCIKVRESADIFTGENRA